MHPTPLAGFKGRGTDKGNGGKETGGERGRGVKGKGR